MRVLIGFLYTSTVLALVTAAVLSIHSDPAFHGPARFAAPPLLLLFLVLLYLRPTAGKPRARTGFLMPDPRPALSEGERNRMLGETLYGGLTGKDAALPDDHPKVHILNEVRRQAEDWCAEYGDPLSDDEVRSLYQLRMYAFPDDRPTSRLPEHYLRDVRNAEPFHRLKSYAESWTAAPVRPEDDFRKWLDHIGDPSMNHLLLNGWVRFLESLPGRDPELLHAIATEFDDIDDKDRLDAAFWILNQPDCDRATASDFIRGFVYWRVLDRMAKDAKATWNWHMIKSFREVILRYNSGGYTVHALPAAQGADPGPEFDDTTMARHVARVVKETGIPKLPRPTGLFHQPADPKDTRPQGYVAPYGYDRDAGLYLKYPGPGWRTAS